MGAYLDKYLKERSLQKEETVLATPPVNELNETIYRIIEAVYGTNLLVRTKQIQEHTFIAARSNIVYDVAVDSASALSTKIRTALMNNYSVEIIYFIQNGLPQKEQGIDYRYIGEYVNVLKARNSSDIVRSINHFRNKFEENYERIRKTQNFASHSPKI